MVPIDQQVILARINGIEGEVASLAKLADLSLDNYKQKPHFQLAEYHLHRALEGVFNIASHINARKAGGATTGGYKDIAKKYGELGFIDREFAEDKMVKMAGYRNRLVHFYANISSEETYNLITQNLEDFRTFLTSVKSLLKNPSKHGLEVE